MKLALRKGPNIGAKWYEVLTSKIIERRLCTDWPHAGIVIGDHLYHATAKGGLISEEFINQGNWTLYDCGEDEDHRVLEQFYTRLSKAKGKVRYDWISLLSFTPILWVARLFGSRSIRYSNWLYCYEWCYEAMLNEPVKSWVTPENLLQIYIEKYSCKKKK